MQQTHTQDKKIATVKIAHQAPLEDKHIFKKRTYLKCSAIGSQRGPSVMIFSL